MNIPQVTLADFLAQPARLLHQALDAHAASRPGDAAIVNATRHTSLSWRQLQERSLAIAARLARLGFRKGDVLATSLPLLDDHVALEYACFRLGVIHAPLDLRLHPDEVLRAIQLTRARGFVCLGKTPSADFGPLATAVGRMGVVEHLYQYATQGECVSGALPFAGLLEPADPPAPVELSEFDGAQVIFTTGSTGSPKPALLSHRGILCQNLCLATGFPFGPGKRILCNLPASHVGGQSEILLTSLWSGATAVTLEVFDPVKSLDAMERYSVTLIGQIPAMFNMEWRSAGFEARHFPALEIAVYGGQAAPQSFLNQMLRMAPTIATGLGLTEASGFCTYTPVTPDAEEVSRGVGWAMPAYPVSVRAPMQADGAAGAPLSNGETGHVCFQGPQNFLGYLHDPAATAAALSTDGWLYTGDLGQITPQGLRLSGRAKWVLKPAGNQVFPGDIEAHFAALADAVANVAVVGQPHSRWSEGIIAFVERRPGAALDEALLRRHARGLTSYMRPLHYVIVEQGSLPLNRAAKVDLMELQRRAEAEVASLRARGRWE